MTSVKSHFAQLQKLQEKNELYRKKRKDDLRRIKNVDQHIEEKEQELIELRTRVDTYEKGVFGLQDAMREIRDLKIVKVSRDKELQECVLKINDYELQVHEFIEENQELRTRLGIDKKTVIDLSNLKSKKQVEFVCFKLI